MASDEDLTRIRQGVTIWNAWRSQNPERAADLRADLSEADLTTAHLDGASLGGAYLSRA